MPSHPINMNSTSLRFQILISGSNETIPLNCRSPNALDNDNDPQTLPSSTNPPA